MQSSIICFVLMSTAMFCGTAQAQLVFPAREIAADSLTNPDFFGFDTDTQSGILVVGAPFSDTKDLLNVGAAYAFEIESGELLWTVAPEGDDLSSQFFGDKIAMDDETVAVGAPYATVNGVRSGAVYLYDLDTGDLLRVIAPDDGVFNEQFGSALDLNEGYLIVGSEREVGNPGRVSVYNAHSGELVRTHQIQPDPLNRLFGHTVLADDGILAIASYQQTCDGTDNFRSIVELFELSTGEYISTVPPCPLSIQFQFGDSMAIANGRILVGSPWSGDAFLFDIMSGELQHRYSRIGLTSSDQSFGASVAMDSGRVFVGAPSYDEPAANAGVVVVFDQENEDYIGHFRTNEPGLSDYLGQTIEIQDNLVLSGAYGRSTLQPNTGSVVVFDLNRFACPADLNQDNILDFFDVSIFLSERLDYVLDGRFDFFDVNSFVKDFSAGCD